jgi:hypothetical protein
MFAEALASFGRAVTGGIFAGDEKAVGITEGTIAYDLLDGEWCVVGLVCECSRSASITGFAGRAEWAAGRFEIFGQEHGVNMFGDIATAGVSFGAAGQELATREKAVGAITAHIAQTLSMPADPDIQGNFIEQ